MAMPDFEQYHVEFRCAGTLHGIMLPNGLFEVKCHHIKCTKGKPGTLFHYIDPRTGEIVDTKMFQDPGRKFR